MFRREIEFKGQLVFDLLGWATAGFLLGGMIGYGIAESANYLLQPAEPKDPVWVGNRDAFRGAIFLFVVCGCGHLLRAIV